MILLLTVLLCTWYRLIGLQRNGCGMKEENTNMIVEPVAV